VSGRVFLVYQLNQKRLPGFAALAVMFPPLLANFVNGQDVILLVTSVFGGDVAC
jgi:hypothetical protein